MTTKANFPSSIYWTSFVVIMVERTPGEGLDKKASYSEKCQLGKSTLVPFSGSTHVMHQSTKLVSHQIKILYSSHLRGGIIIYHPLLRVYSVLFVR